MKTTIRHLLAAGALGLIASGIVEAGAAAGNPVSAIPATASPATTSPATGTTTDTRYVRHLPSVPLVSDPGPEAVIVKRLVPGDPVRVIAEQGDFVNVEATGTTGWVRLADLTRTTPPALQLEALRADLDKSKGRQAALEREKAELEQQLRTARANARNAELDLEATESSATEELNETKVRVDELEAELELSQQALKSARERVNELEMARSASQLLARTPAKTERGVSNRMGESTLYYIAGLGGMLLGLLLGVLWRNRQLKKRYYGMEL